MWATSLYGRYRSIKEPTTRAQPAPTTTASMPPVAPRQNSVSSAIALAIFAIASTAVLMARRPNRCDPWNTPRCSSAMHHSGSAAASTMIGPVVSIFRKPEIHGLAAESAMNATTPAAPSRHP